MVFTFFQPAKKKEKPFGEKMTPTQLSSIHMTYEEIML